MKTTDEIQMQCMEVWGGNQSTDATVALGGLDAWVYSRPFENSPAGGDVHYVSSCASGRLTRILVADVSGHGKTASKTATALRAIMRRFVNYIDQNRFVETMNQFFSDREDAGRFATALVMSFFAPTRKLTICRAGHPQPLLYRARTGRWTTLNDSRESDKFVNAPLGVMDNMRYEQHRERLDVGDMVLCYTDALWESHDRDGKMLRTEGLVRIANEVDNSTPAEFINKLLCEIRTRGSGNSCDDDDVTALLVQANGRGTTLKNNLLAPIRVLTGWLTK